MTPEDFIARWKDNDLTERAGAQAHFDDLCELLGVDKPRQPGEYQFEYGAKKASGGDGWADVWKRGHFGWENKKPGRDLKAALKQLTDYALNLENPPLLVVSDRERIEIHTAFTGYPDEPRRIHLADIGQPENLQTLRWVFTDPDSRFPAITSEEEAAGFPPRPVAKPGHEADLKKRTLTNLYNQRPPWLANAHQTLDHAVAAAYGWTDYTPAWTDDDILRRLLALNLARTA